LVKLLVLRVLYVYESGSEVVVFLPFYPRKQTKHNEGLAGQKMIKVLAQPTNKAEPFWTNKGSNLRANTLQNFALVCMRFLTFTGSTFHLLSFVSI